jgi:hypothetical protein
MNNTLIKNTHNKEWRAELGPQYLEKSIGVLEHPADNCMAGLVVGNDSLLLRVQDSRLLLRAGYHSLQRVICVIGNINN